MFTTSATPADRRALLVWLAAVAAYGCAVFQRTTFGVAGLAAAHRFDAPAGIVSTFVVVQLVTYVLMQVPGGLLLDRFGPRRMLTAGLVVMTAGQVAVAFAAGLPAGLTGRVLLGAGDAAMFAGAVRLVPSWFAPSRVPMLTQVTGMAGQLGQIVSAVPFAMALTAWGWTPTFLAAAAVCAVAALITPALVRDRPPAAPAAGDAGAGASGEAVETPVADRLGLWRQVVEAWRTPGTRLGLWTHFGTGFPSMTFVLMWGFPYLTRGEGLAPAAASGLLTLFVLVGLPFAPTIGAMTRRYPLRRSNLALGVVASGLVAWLAVLLWPGPAPLWLLALLMVMMAAGGPGSVIGFDLARTSNPAHRLGTANGIVIMGGFVGALIAILLIGVILDVAGAAGGAGGLRDFRLAMAVQVPMMAIALVGIVRARSVARAHRLAVEGLAVRPLHVALRDARARRRGASGTP